MPKSEEELEITLVALRAVIQLLEKLEYNDRKRVIETVSVFYDLGDND